MSPCARPITPTRAIFILLLLTVLLATGCGGDDRPLAAAGELRQRWPVMGTMLEIVVWDADTARARAAVAAARGAVFRVDTLMSLWKPASDLSAVNRRAGTDSVTVVDPQTAQVLASALDWAERSGGAFDPTVGPLVDVWGFYGARGGLPPTAAADSALGLVAWSDVAFDPARRAVALPRAGMRLDLGAIAKGWAVDRAVEALRTAGVPSAMVDLGGNVRVHGPRPGGGPWQVGIRDPRRPDELLAVLALDSGAVATSGDYEQFFVVDGVRYAHILDARSGAPARGVAATTVRAASGMAADALSTVLFLLGPEAGCALLAGMPDAAALWLADPDPAGTLPAGEVLAVDAVGSDQLLEHLTWQRPGGGPARTCGAPPAPAGAGR